MIIWSAQLPELIQSTWEYCQSQKVDSAGIQSRHCTKLRLCEHRVCVMENPAYLDEDTLQPDQTKKWVGAAYIQQLERQVPSPISRRAATVKAAMCEPPAAESGMLVFSMVFRCWRRWPLRFSRR